MAYIGNSPTNIVRGRRAVYEFTATAGQTVFTGVDNNGLSLDLLEANENDVYLNGSRLVLNDDYTVSGDTLTLLSAAALNDILIIVTQDEIANASSYTKAESDSRYINYNGDIVNGDLQVVGNISLGDNNKINLGGSSDLRIFHDGSDSFITNDTGQLILRVASVENALVAVPNGAVSLYYDNLPKLSTTSTGVDVTGRANTVGITSSDNSHIFTSPSYNIIDFISDNNDDGSNDDIIVNFRNGSAGTVKAELRWDESSDTFEISRADNRGDLVISSDGQVSVSNNLVVGKSSTVQKSGTNIFKVHNDTNWMDGIVSGQIFTSSNGIVNTGITLQSIGNRAIFEVFGGQNPNNLGSTYFDPIHMFVYVGVGYSYSPTASVKSFIYSHMMAPPARDVFGSGSSASANIGYAVFWDGSTESEYSDNGSHTIRLVFPYYNVAGDSGTWLNIIRRA